LPRQFQADISPATATLRQPQLSAPPSTAKTQIAHYRTTVPILAGVLEATLSFVIRSHRGRNMIDILASLWYHEL